MGLAGVGGGSSGSCQRSRWWAFVGEMGPLRFLVFSNTRSFQEFLFQ